MINVQVITSAFIAIDSTSDFFQIKSNLNNCAIGLAKLSEHDLRETLFAFSMMYRDRILNLGSQLKAYTGRVHSKSGAKGTLGEVAAEEQTIRELLWFARRYLPEQANNYQADRVVSSSLSLCAEIFNKLKGLKLLHAAAINTSTPEVFLEFLVTCGGDGRIVDSARDTMGTRKRNAKWIAQDMAEDAKGEEDCLHRNEYGDIPAQIIHLITCFWFVMLQLVSIKKQESKSMRWTVNDYRLAILQGTRVITSFQHSSPSMQPNWEVFVIGSAYSVAVDQYIDANKEKYAVSRYSVDTKIAICNRKTIGASLINHPYFMATVYLTISEKLQVGQLSDEFSYLM